MAKRKRAFSIKYQFIRLIVVIGFLVIGFISFHSVSSVLALESGLSIYSNRPFLSGTTMYGQGGYSVPSGSYQRQLQVCLQFSSSPGNWYNATLCKLYTGTAKSVGLSDTKSTQATSSYACWRTWTWYWTSYDNTSTTRTSDTNCTSGRKPLIL